MPPKAKKEKPTKSKATTKDDTSRPSGMGIILQAELDRKVRELAETKLRIRMAQEKNNWLNEEATRIRIETVEYSHYMSKKANLRQEQIVTLTDYHREEIDQIHRDQKSMLQQYDEKKQELRRQLLGKEQRLVQVNEDLETMRGYQSIQEEQNDQIKCLQDKVAQVRSEHACQMAKIKSKLEEEIQRQRMDDYAQVHLIQRQAEKEAEQFLYLRAVSIQNENGQLRQTLQDLLRQTRTLSDCKQRLEEEQLHLVNRLKLVADLKRIRLDNLTSTALDDLSASASGQ